MVNHKATHRSCARLWLLSRDATWQENKKNSGTSRERSMSWLASTLDTIQTANVHRSPKKCPKSSIRGEVNKKLFTFGRIFCGFPAPLVIEQDLFSLSAPKARDAADNRVAFVGFLPAVFMTRFATKPVTCETSKQTVGHVPTMVLSGTRGPLLFQVIREGLGSAVRLGARGTVRLTFQLRLALEPECLKYRANHRWD